MQYTSKGDPAQVTQKHSLKLDTHAQVTGRGAKQLDGKTREPFTTSYGSTGAQLPVKKATASVRLEPFEQDGKVMFEARQNVSHYRHSARTGFVEAEVFPGLPDTEFGHIEKVHKDTGVAISSSELRPKRTGRRSNTGHMEEKQNIKDWSQESKLWARGQ